MPLKLVSMKRKPEPKDDDEKDGACCAPDYDRPDYPWGTRLTIENDQLDALGLTGELPAVGTTMDMVAIVSVISTRSESVEGGKMERRLELQVTDMAVQPPGPSLAERMYGAGAGAKPTT